jgi:hypothetical protein
VNQFYLNLGQIILSLTIYGKKDWKDVPCPTKILQCEKTSGIYELNR